MRSHQWFTAVASTVLLSAGPLEAQARRYFGTLALGPAVPVGEFSDGFGAGWTVSAGVGTALASKSVELRATASLGSFGASGGSDASSKPFALTGDVLYHLGGRDGGVRPYLLAGAGFSSVGYSYSYEGPGGGFSERENGVTLGAGGGVMMRRGRAAVFAEGRVAAVPGSGHSHIPVLVGVRFGDR